MPKMLYIAPYCFGLEESLASSLTRQGYELDKIIYGAHESSQPKLIQKLFAWRGYGFVRDLKKIASKLGLLDIYVARRLRAFNDEVRARFDRFKPDLVFVIKGETLLPETVDYLKSLAPCVAYYWDDPFLRFAQQMDGTSDLRHRNAMINAPKFDYTFVYDPTYVTELTRLGARNVSYLMDWYEPELFRPLQLTAEQRIQYGAEVAFVGAPYENRVKLLDQLREFQVGIWGPYFRWKEFFAAYPFIERSYRGEADGKISAFIYNASKISLNVHDTQQCVDSVNNRTFQIIACGAFELVDERPKVHELFETGAELDTYTDGADLVAKVKHYLSDSKLREAAARRSLAKSALHSADVRAAQMIEAITSG